MRLSILCHNTYKVAHDMQARGSIYSNRMDDGRPTILARKMLRRRIAQVRACLDAMENQLAEDEEEQRTRICTYKRTVQKFGIREK